MAIALDKNPLQRAASEGVAAAKAIVGLRRSSYYPQIDATGGYSRWERHIFLPEGVTRPGMSSTVGPTEDWTASLNLRYSLYDSGKRRAELMSALFRQQASEQTAREIRQDIIQNVHRAYYGYLAAQDANQIAKQNLRKAENHLEIAQKRRSAGQIPQAEVLRVKVDVSEANLSLVRTQKMIRIAQGQLNRSMGLPAEIPVSINDQHPAFQEPTKKRLYSALQKAVYLRPELKAALNRISAAKSNIKAAKSEYGPDVSARASYGRQDDGFFPNDDSWMVGIFVELPLFDGFARDNNVRHAKAQLSEQEALLQNLILEVKQQVWNDFAKLKEAYQALEATKTIVEEAQEGMRLTQERYQVGQSTTNDLLDARTALVRAEGNRAQAGWDYYTALSDFHRAVGTFNFDL
ncbi:Outer membrane protein OprM precursor [Sedimentisphaera cyanobacteriorum]|uniref:Outer membrane protein OprM n=1 Tax=Sedimentisphaera cyanobacteriorum TaxID=1940790 RepID=A0A1Q2HPB2_9BACT|nr:TolC family protein [Sedimentisphaera cyanobacteriorum]AQQ09210.1 Outer membrane protein OprM precursor [Sedimentisphaera cyanobacteriorum]